ncbi:hypothetical protein DWV00_25730 [Trinickia dinghuensis]|uniref:Uncharacterized protein n=2 Tax=Trinickia dinghuensis TaxID=2291023 RepID=A0A3D8JUI7_9BURK|nr:hypothetical protein DWV00_25730 [Trinickia dinghuensis]
MDDRSATARGSDGAGFQQSSPQQLRFRDSKDPAGIIADFTQIDTDGHYRVRGSARRGRLDAATGVIGHAAPAPLNVKHNDFAGIVSLAPGWNTVTILTADLTGEVGKAAFQVYRPQLRSMLLTDPKLVALKPLIASIYASYGIDADSPPLEQTRAVRDWVARTMVHPESRFHPNGSVADAAVLPASTSWEDVNAILTWNKIEADQTFWEKFHYDGYAMLDALLGTLDRASSRRENNGLMEQIEPGRFRIRDIRTFKYPFCTYQVAVLQVLWAAAGFASVALSVNGHDPAAVFIPNEGWVYSDPTFNEELRASQHDSPLAPAEALDLARSGARADLHPLKGIGPGRTGPLWDNEQYIAGSATYFDFVRNGFSYLRVLTDNRLLGGRPDRQIVTVSGSDDPKPGPVVSPEAAFRAPPDDASAIRDARTLRLVP